MTDIFFSTEVILTANIGSASLSKPRRSVAMTRTVL
jgi:hypothetical protein